MIHYELEIIMININSKVYIAGYNGMLGSSIFRKLKKKDIKIITIDKRFILEIKCSKKNFSS